MSWLVSCWGLNEMRETLGASSYREKRKSTKSTAGAHPQWSELPFTQLCRTCSGGQVKRWLVSTSDSQLGPATSWWSPRSVWKMSQNVSLSVPPQGTIWREMWVGLIQIPYSEILPGRPMPWIRVMFSLYLWSGVGDVRCNSRAVSFLVTVMEVNLGDQEIVSHVSASILAVVIVLSLDSTLGSLVAVISHGQWGQINSQPLGKPLTTHSPLWNQAEIS